MAPVVTWNDAIIDYPAVFAQNGNFLTVLQDGLYSLLVRLFWFTSTDSATAEIFFSGVDADNFAAYSFPSVYATTFNSVSSALLIARLAANQDVEVTVRQQSGVAWTIDGSKGSLWETVRLGSATMTGRDFP